MKLARWIGFPLLIAAVAFTGTLYVKKHLASTQTKCVIHTKWHGEIDDQFARKIEDDLKSAVDSKCDLEVDLISTGGQVPATLEIVRQMVLARAKGVKIVIFGREVVASGASLILAYGSFGHRFVAPNTFIVIHAMRGIRGCMDYENTPKAGEKTVLWTIFGPIDIEVSAEEAAAIQLWVKALDEAYSAASKVTHLSCKAPIAGGPDKAIEAGIADGVK